MPRELTDAAVNQHNVLMILPIAVSIFSSVLDEMPQYGRQMALFQMPNFQLEEPNWRPWEGSLDKPSNQKSQESRGSQVASATVEVVEYSDSELHQRLLEFKAHTMHLLRIAYDTGFAFRTNIQMFGEFMLQDPAHPHPTSVPSVFYNNFMPRLEDPARVDRPLLK